MLRIFLRFIIFLSMNVKGDTMEETQPLKLYQVSCKSFICPTNVFPISLNFLKESLDFIDSIEAKQLSKDG